MGKELPRLAAKPHHDVSNLYSVSTVASAAASVVASAAALVTEQWRWLGQRQQRRTGQTRRSSGGGWGGGGECGNPDNHRFDTHRTQSTLSDNLFLDSKHTHVCRLKVEFLNFYTATSNFWPIVDIFPSRILVTQCTWIFLFNDFSLPLFGCVCPERVSKRGSVRPSIHYARAKSAFLGCLSGQGEVLYWIKRSPKVFWEPPLLLCRFICLFVHLSLHIWHICSAEFNTHRDTVRTHRC